MFQKILNWIKGVLGQVFDRNTIDRVARTEVAVSDRMAAAISLWGSMYTGDAPWISEQVKSLNLPAAIATEVARLSTVEMVSTISGSARAAYLEAQYQVVMDDLRRITEYGCAQGGIALKPYIDGKRISVDYVQADLFFPIAYDSRGKITGAVFCEQKTVGKNIYTRLERHVLVGTMYQIQNTVFVSSNPAVLGRQTVLAEVEEWAGLEEEATIRNVERPLFAYFKFPAANVVDTTSPLGASVYARAVGLIREADLQYSRMLWEFEGSELALYVDSAALEVGADGKASTPKLSGRLLHALDTDNDSFFSVFSPAIRDASLINGLNELLMRIEDACGLARGVFSNPQGEAKTATELKILRQRSYATVTDTQKALQTALEQLVYAMDVWATLGKLAPAGKYEVNFQWDDSVVTDLETKRAQDLQDVRDGLMAKWEYRMKYYGEDEKTAKKMAEEAGGTSDGNMLFGDE